MVEQSNATFGQVVAFIAHLAHGEESVLLYSAENEHTLSLTARRKRAHASFRYLYTTTIVRPNFTNTEVCILLAPKAVVVLRGKVDSRNEEAIKKALVKIIHDFTDIKGQLNLELEKDVYKTTEG